MNSNIKSKYARQPTVNQSILGFLWNDFNGPSPPTPEKLQMYRHDRQIKVVNF